MVNQPPEPDLGFTVLEASSRPYRVHFISRAFESRALDVLVARGDPETQLAFPPSDLESKRVALVERARGGVLCCSPMSWAQHRVTAKDELRNRLPPKQRLHVLSVAVLLETAEGNYILSRRSQQVASYKDHWHVSAAGYADYEKARSSMSLLHQVFAELYEEVNVSPSDILRVEQLGLGIHTKPNNAMYEVLFRAWTKLTDAEVLERAQRALDAYEGKVHVFSKDTVARMMCAEPFVPVALAAIKLAFSSPS